MTRSNSGTNRRRALVASILLATGAGAAGAATTEPTGVAAEDCARLANSALAAPAWYAEGCRGHYPEAVILPVATGGEPAPNVIGDTTYQHDLRAAPNTFESFALPNAATSTVIGTQAEDYFALEHDNATGVLWAIRNAPLPLALGQINKTTGAFTAGPTVTGLQGTQNITGLAFVNSSSTFYVSGADGTVSTLYSLNPTTGALTVIGQTGTTLMIDIALNNAGVMYGHDIGTDSIYTINTATGAATLIGPTGIPANFAQSIDVDKSTGVLYGWVYQGAGVNQFVSFNLTSGAATALATPTNKEYEGATVPVELQSFSVD
jgi:hypothetical protein